MNLNLIKKYFINFYFKSIYGKIYMKRDYKNLAQTEKMSRWVLGGDSILYTSLIRFGPTNV